MLKKDITGLRAIAVLGVALFHLGLIVSPDNSVFKGGFLGVDIFFVISGFLMTKIIMTGFEHNNFSLWTFYKRRAKRIVPALVAVTIVFLCLGYFVLTQEAFKIMAAEARQAVSFYSNIKYANNTDYFNNSTLDHFFLHSWSLSVEWQFYLVYPIILMLIKRFLGVKHIPLIVGISFVISFGYAIYLTNTNAKLSYYLLHTRAFELLAGALALFFSVDNLKGIALANNKLSFVAKLLSFSPKVYEALGLIIIFVSIFTISSADGWPNFYAIIPIFGAYLCIAANNEKSFLSNIVFQKIGLWSYAIYLVHWPLIIFANRLSLNEQYIYLSFVIFVLGWLLHTTVEKRRNYGYAFLVIYICCNFSFQYLRSFDLNNIRGTSASKELYAYASYGGDNFTEYGKPIYFGENPEQPDIILLDDSYVRQYLNDIDTRGLNVISVASDSCISVENVQRYFEAETKVSKACENIRNHIDKVLEKHPNVPVIWAQNWDGYKSLLDLETNKVIMRASVQGQTMLLKALEKRFNRYPNNKFYIIGPIGSDQNQSAAFLFSLSLLNNSFSQYLYNIVPKNRTKVLPERLYTQDIGEFVKDFDNVTFVDLNNVFCNKDKECDLFVDNSILPLANDGGHLSWAGSNKALTYILDIMGIEQGKPDPVLERLKKDYQYN